MPRTHAALAWSAAGGGAIVIALVATVPPSTGCSTHRCDSSAVPWTGGEMIDPNTYESGPLNGPWVPFGPNETLQVTYPDDVQRIIAGRTVADVRPYVGIDQTPNFGPDFVGGDQWVAASGQLAYLNYFGPRGFWVTNATCAGYFLRIVVAFPELDGGAQTDASDSSGLAPDAASEASDITTEPVSDAGSDAPDGSSG